MKIRIFLLVVMSLGSCTRQPAADSGTKIVNGEEVSGSRFPKVALLTMSTGICTASKISAKLWITAAHCVTSNRNDPGGISIEIHTGQVLKGRAVYVSSRALASVSVQNNFGGTTQVSAPDNVAIVETQETPGDYYRLGPFSAQAVTQIVGFGVANNCGRAIEGGSIDETGSIGAKCDVETANSSAGTLRTATISPTQINAVNSEVVTFVGPIAPDNSGLAGAGYGDSGSPLLQGNTIVGILDGAQFSEYALRSANLAIHPDNRLLVIYVHSQSPSFCEVIKLASGSNQAGDSFSLQSGCDVDLADNNDPSTPNGGDSSCRTVDNQNQCRPDALGKLPEDCRPAADQSTFGEVAYERSKCGIEKVDDGSGGKGYAEGFRVIWPRSQHDYVSDTTGVAGLLESAKRFRETMLKQEQERYRANQNVQTATFQQ